MTPHIPALTIISPHPASPTPPPHPSHSCTCGLPTCVRSMDVRIRKSAFPHAPQSIRMRSLRALDTPLRIYAERRRYDTARN
ncbi:hypothetical protein CC2G_009748 [Coprinopsis cinerea AmutBmut pab1-1]|nr:hypothetical protein CC2G_009748 [Coprinopsis cinerea AmutBmut pab1-1]